MSCRVCLKDSKQKLQLFSKSGRQKHIAEILEKHLWFFSPPDDPLSKFVCMKCWTKISDFDKFYENVKKLHMEKLQELDNGKLEIKNTKENSLLKADLSGSDIDFENDNMYVTVLVDDINFSENDKTLLFENQNTELNIENERNDVIKFNYANEDETVQSENFEHIKQRTDSNEQNQLNQTSRKSCSKTLPNSKRKRSQHARSLNAAEDDKIVRKHICLSCELCNYNAESFTEIVKHFLTTHANVRAYISCCGRRFTKRERLVQHAWLHEDPAHFQCPICERIFRDNDIKNAHMKSQHPTEEQLIHHCDQCEKRFARKYLLKLHKAVHIPVDEREFFCNKCTTPKAFASQNQLNIHNSMIHNRQANVCDVCGKTIRDRQAFKKHVRLHFEDSGPRVKCPEPGCESWLKDEDNLKQHLRRHNSSCELLQCDQCNKLCKDRRALTCHKRSVHPDILLSCEICGKLFKKAISLKEHMATHTGEALYECPFCTHKFKSNANMHAHKKKMHPTEWEICKNLNHR